MISKPANFLSSLLFFSNSTFNSLIYVCASHLHSSICAHFCCSCFIWLVISASHSSSSLNLSHSLHMLHSLGSSLWSPTVLLRKKPIAFITTGKTVIKKTIKLPKYTNRENSRIRDSTIADLSLFRKNTSVVIGTAK